MPEIIYEPCRQALGAEAGSESPRADQSSSSVRQQLGTPSRGICRLNLFLLIHCCLWVTFTCKDQMTLGLSLRRLGVLVTMSRDLDLLGFSPLLVSIELMS